MKKELIVAGGCFWGVEAYFKQLKGITDTSVGYIDGNKRHPSYREVCDGNASHTEACKLSYDNEVISIAHILEHFFRFVNPYSVNKQGNDIGSQYRSGIYYEDESDLEAIQQFMIDYFKEKISLVKTDIKKAVDYDLAEPYHQDYLDKNPNGYCHVNLGLAKKEEKK